ncbi:glycine zipper domain-containing protein [Schlesneria paludicola]|uniref:glycine zipper domain-containing protein n=1 Tax=Schlesneria paludicola TaxID=360056 RepID=UPI00029ADB35|nr:YMGG-like glycine zipper-containing protein [Schlesneria paludicola]
MRHLTKWLQAAFKKYSGRSRVIRRRFLCLTLSAIALLPGCQYSNNRQAGTALGSGIGALTGALIGQDSGHLFGGALIGALAGGVTGGLIGNAADVQEQREAAAVTHAQYLASTGQALTNIDVIRMVQSGLSDEVIIGTVKHSVGNYDLSPNAMIQLKTYGTSDRVILTLQKLPKIPALPGSGGIHASPSTSVGVVVAPAPVMVYGYHGGPSRRHW